MVQSPRDYRPSADIVVVVVSIAHVITGLSVGGAEMVLWHLLQNTDPLRFPSIVVSLTGTGELAGSIGEAGYEVVSLRESHQLAPVSAWQLTTLLRARKPDVVQTWMYHADLMGGLSARAAGISRVVWGLHAGPLPPRGQKLGMKAGVRLLARLSKRVPSRIICCSHTSKDVHESLGYDRSKMVVIPNGFPVVQNLSHKPSLLREELGISVDRRVVGRVGRLHPQKDLSTLLRAFALLPDDVHLVLVGQGLERSNAEVARELAELPLVIPRVHLLGERRDIAGIYGGCDLIVSSSAFGEALPMVLGEAMAAGTPVVTTDVGDSARLVADPARVVLPGQPNRLARAMQHVLSLTPEARKELGRRDRARVSDHYSVAGMVAGYEELYESLLA